MTRIGRPIRCTTALATIAVLAWCAQGWAVSLDQKGELKLGVRTYVNARVGTEDTHDGAPATPFSKLTNGTFPHSDAGHLRQNRYFLEAEFKHDLSRLMKEGVGPLSLLNDLPVRFTSLGYQFTFRGEGESLYDWGPSEYSTAREYEKVRRLSPVPLVLLGQQLPKNNSLVDVAGTRHEVHKRGTDRERLFQAFVEANVGDLFVRFGRQVLSWGETDGFQLLDHINPLDSSFGGFLVSLDERRIPLDMLLGNYYLGDFGPFSEAHLEGYVAIDNKVGFDPAPPPGSPWLPPALGAPTNVTTVYAVRPARTINNARGGVQLKFNLFDATFGLAHYYTYFDIPATQVLTTKNLTTAFNDGRPCALIDGSGAIVRDAQGNPVEDPTNRTCGTATHTLLTAPKVQVSGASTTFAVPQLYSVVRSEVAYFKDEPAFTQGQLDPFIFNPIGPGTHKTTGGRRLRDSFNAVVGIDANQWVRFLNPNQTFFFSTQLFYKHILNAAGSNIYNCTASSCTLNPDREVLPVPALAPSSTNLGPVEPTFIQQPKDQFLQTLLIATSYRSGIINPALVIFYDWGGAFLYQPTVTLSRDPFRFTLAYSIVDAHSYKGGSGVSLLKDRDNVEFRFEYVI